MEDKVYHGIPCSDHRKAHDGSSHYMTCQTEYGTLASLEPEHDYFVSNCLPNSPEISLASLKRDRDKYGVDRDAQDHLRILHRFQRRWKDDFNFHDAYDRLLSRFGAAK